MADGGHRGGRRGWRADTRLGARPDVGTPWRGSVSRTAAFAVSGARLYLAGSPVCVGRRPSLPRPVFVRTLPSGPWRVATTTAGRGEVELAAAGRWLAVAAPDGMAMAVTVSDRAGRRARYRVDGLAPGRPSLDTAGRLLVAALTDVPSFPFAAPALLAPTSFALTLHEAARRAY